jgi:hypothetical protein
MPPPMERPVAASNRKVRQNRFAMFNATLPRLRSFPPGSIAVGNLLANLPNFSFIPQRKPERISHLAEHGLKPSGPAGTRRSALNPLIETRDKPRCTGAVSVVFGAEVRP